MSNDIPIPGQKVVGPYLSELRDQVARLLHIRHNRFPGAQPVSFTQDNVNDLLNRNFFVCEKTDGLRIMLFATYNRQEKKYESFLINRSHDFYYTKVLLPIPPEPGVKPYTMFHHGTLIDGELIVDTEPDGRQVMRYLVFDCLTCRDKVLIARPFRIRLGHFHDFVLKPLKRMATERPDLTQRIPFQIEAKQMQLSYHVKEIFAEQPMLKHKSDGLIFTSSEEPYTLGTDQNILKWKPANENTVDFLLRHNSRGEMELHLWHGGNRHEYHCLLQEQDPNKLSMLRGANGKIIECHYEPASNPPWHFMRFRSDKNTANHFSVFEKIMQSIRDGVTQDHLESMAPQARTNWKFRESNPHLAPPPPQRPPPPLSPAAAPSPHHGPTSSAPPSLSRTRSAPASVSPHPSMGSASSHHLRDASPPHPSATAARYHSSPGVPDWDARPRWDDPGRARTAAARVPDWDSGAAAAAGSVEYARDRDRDTYRPVSPGHDRDRDRDVYRPVSPGREVFGHEGHGGAGGLEFADVAAARYGQQDRVQGWRGDVSAARPSDGYGGGAGAVREFADESGFGGGKSRAANEWVPDWELPEDMQKNGRRTVEDVFVDEGDGDGQFDEGQMEQDDGGDVGGYGDEGGEYGNWGEERLPEEQAEVEPTLVDKYAHDWDVELDQDEDGGGAGSGMFGFAAGATKAVAPANTFASLIRAVPVSGSNGSAVAVDSSSPASEPKAAGSDDAAAAPTSLGSSHSSLPLGEPMDDGDDDYDDDDDGYVYRPSSP